MEINEAQEWIKKWNEKRDWGKIVETKDLMLNMTEEIGEAWNVIKWIHEEDQLKTVIKENKGEFEDFIGDVLYLTFKLAYILGIDSEKAIKRTMNDYEKRFPEEEVKGKHGNLRFGGIDKKE